MLTITKYGSSTQNWVRENAANWPTIAACVAATLSRNRWVQAVALIVILSVWVWYFVTLQSALS